MRDTLALGDSRAASLASELIAQAVILDRYAVQVSEEQLRQLEQSRVIFPAGARLPSAEQMLVDRELRFQHETRGERILESVRQYVEMAELLEHLPRRPLTPAQVQVVDAARSERQAWFQALRIRAFYVAPWRVLGDRPAGFEHQLFADATAECEAGPAGSGWIVELSTKAEVTLAPRPYSSVVGAVGLEWP